MVLLEKVVAENVRLREAIEKRDTEQQKLLERLSSKLDSTDPVPPKANRKRRRKIAVPQPCRVSISRVFLSQFVIIYDQSFTTTAIYTHVSLPGHMAKLDRNLDWTLDWTLD